MKKILLFLFLIMTTGCSLFNQNTEDKIEILIDDSIVVNPTKINVDNYDWNQHISVEVNDKVINDRCDISLFSGDPYQDDLCTFIAAYFHNGKTYQEYFNVHFTHVFDDVRSIYQYNEDEMIRIKGHISCVNSMGFIISDDSASAFAYYSSYDEYIPKVNDNIELFGKIVFDDGLLISVTNIIHRGNSIYNANFSEKNVDELVEIADNFKTNNYLVQEVLLSGNIKKTEGYYLSTDSINVKLEGVNKSVINFLDENPNSVITIKGYIYSYLEKENILVMMVRGYGENEVTQPDTNYLPTIIVDADYYHYMDISDVDDLATYFEATDYEDGHFEIKEDMIDGSIELGENIITLSVADSDKNLVSKSITIHVGPYLTKNLSKGIEVIDENCMPSTGESKALVIPVAIGNHPATNSMRQVIQKAFFGNESDTGWESLSSYYYESSYGKLTITGEVTNWYHAKRSQNEYAKYYDDDDYIYGSTIILEEALEYFSDTYDYSDFDSNKDGYIDAVYLIYNVPIGGNGSHYEEDFYWAFTYWDMSSDERTYQATKGYSYVFMSYDFFDEDLEYSSKNLTINCETLIHETGHLFNLDDLYDFVDGDEFNNSGGYCGVDMMDFNIGDHGPYSKLLLDWIEPVVITKSGIYALPAFTTNGIAFAISNKKMDSLFAEYYLIDYFTFDGLNELQLKDYFNTNRDYAGVRVSQVNSVLEEDIGYYPYFQYNNGDTKFKQIKLLEADYDGTFDLSISNDGATLNDFYQPGTIFGVGAYENYKSSTGLKLPFTMEVLSCDKNQAYIKITMR